jgi:hypothetical protein
MAGARIHIISDNANAHAQKFLPRSLTPFDSCVFGCLLVRLVNVNWEELKMSAPVTGGGDDISDGSYYVLNCAAKSLNVGNFRQSLWICYNLAGTEIVCSSVLNNPTS